VSDESRGSGHVLLAEDDDGWRSLVAETIRAAGYTVVEAATGAEAIAHAQQSRPALTLLDVVLPGLSGYEVCRRLREQFGEELPIMLMSGQRAEPYDRMAGLALGADDYLVKPFELEELLALIRKHSRRLTHKQHDSNGVELTKRQREVLRLLAEGLTQKEIAERLVISPRTVGAHTEQLFVKLSVHSRAQAVARAHREHLLET
jgi:DNA-binding NarL/FixJ family response regulator